MGAKEGRGKWEQEDQDFIKDWRWEVRPEKIEEYLLGLRPE